MAGSRGAAHLAPTLFAVVLLSVISVAIVHPAAFSWYNVDPNVSLGLGMFFIGHAIELKDLKSAPPQLWLYGVLSSLLVFPCVGLGAAALAAYLGLPSQMVAGLVVTAACPPGSASNLVPTRLCGLPVAPVALLCALFTLTAAWTFPLIITGAVTLLKHLFGDELLNHPCWSQLTYTATSHLAASPFLTHGAVSLTLPFLAGYLSRMTLTFILTHTASKRVADTTIRTLSLCLPPLAILVTAANKLALNVELTRGFPVLVAGVLAVHAGAFALGYLITMLAGADRTTCQVSSIQAGARNPAVGVLVASALLRSYGSLAVAPCAISVWGQNAVGCVVEAMWSWLPPEQEAPEQRLRKKRATAKRAKQA